MQGAMAQARREGQGPTFLWQGLLDPPPPASPPPLSQGDRERQLGLPISPLSDRSKPEAGVTKSQAGFYEFIALPMVFNMAAVFPEVKTGLLRSMRQTYQAWKSMQAGAEGPGDGKISRTATLKELSRVPTMTTKELSTPSD